MDIKLKGILVATAAAGLIGCGGGNANNGAPATPDPSGATAAKTKCTGLNECKGKGSCAQADHACGGKNACKGQGITLVTTPDECTTKGGKTL
jgi:hypothetical protein